MIDQEQNTQTNEPPNSEGDQTTNNQSSDQDTSSTTTNQQQTDGDDDHVDLGTGKSNEVDGNQDEDTRTDEQKATDEAAEAERAKLFGAPEGDAPYEIAGLPEGMDIDKEALAAITPVARKLDLSNEGMSAIAQVYATNVLPGVAQKVIEGLNADTLATRKQWEGEARDLIAGKGEPLATATGDKIEFGGRSLADVQRIAAKALDRVAPAGFREWLDETGLGVHPQMIAFAYQIGKDIAEDSDHDTGEPSQRKVSSDGRPMTDAGKFYNR